MALVSFTTLANRWGMGNTVTITVEKSENGEPILTDKERSSATASAKMEYNGIQLRFEVLLTEKLGAIIYIVFDHEHNPPQPIKEMYKQLS
ncbi:MAG: hypothetical protein ABIJ81_03210 [Patescibacteria group bacterium]